MVQQHQQQMRRRSNNIFEALQAEEDELDNNVVMIKDSSNTLDGAECDTHI